MFITVYGCEKRNFWLMLHYGQLKRTKYKTSISPLRYKAARNRARRVWSTTATFESHHACFQHSATVDTCL